MNVLYIKEHPYLLMYTLYPHLHYFKLHMYIVHI
jgi:hypothetical protein